MAGAEAVLWPRFWGERGRDELAAVAEDAKGLLAEVMYLWQRKVRRALVDGLIGIIIGAG